MLFHYFLDRIFYTVPPTDAQDTSDYSETFVILNFRASSFSFRIRRGKYRQNFGLGLSHFVTKSSCSKSSRLNNSSSKID